MYDQGALLSIDIDELGVRPLNWSDDNKELDDSIIDYFGAEKTVDFTVYSAEIQTFNDGKKLITTDDDSSMLDDEDSIEYDIDPETGELKTKLDHSFSSFVSSNQSIEQT